MIQCFNPVQIPRKSKSGVFDYSDIISVPCGKCEACRLRNVENWKHRAMYEIKYSANSYFVTLTYDDDHVTYDKDSGEPTLVREDYRLFLKRLRHFLYSVDGKYRTEEEVKMRYLLCGEYGTKNDRPHFHAILFDLPWNGHREIHHRYVCDTLEKAWSKGYVYVTQVQPGAIDYVCSYVLGKYDWKRVVEPPFMVASNHIGMAYVARMKEWHKEHPEERTGMQMGNGKTVTMPRYIQDKIFSPEENDLVNFKKKMALEEIRQKQLEQFKDQSYSLFKYHEYHQDRAKVHFQKKKDKRFHVKSNI